MAAPLTPCTRRQMLRNLCALALAGPAPPQTLYQQSLARSLLPLPGIELLLFDPRADLPLLDSFADSAQPIPAGSLLKPFLALAYAQSHRSFPAVVCHGHADRCWSAEGHGQLSLPQAIAQSCNTYFIALAHALQPGSIPYLPPPPDASAETLIGLTPAWPIAPLTLTRAYAALLTAPLTPALDAIRQGMRLSATAGTAARIGRHPGGVLAKTGTAPCMAGCRASGDGLVLAAVPARQPTRLLLLRHRATTGAATAADAGQLLTRLGALHAC